MEQGLNPEFLRSLEAVLEGRWASRIMLIVVIPVLAIAAVVLPPLALPERILSAGYTTITRDGGSVLDPDGTQLTIPPGSVSGEIQVRLSSTPRADFLAGTAGDAQIAEAIPANLEMKSPLYSFAFRGEKPQTVTISVPIPNDAEPLSTLDLYAWTGREWQWIPRTIYPEDDVVETTLSSFPQAVAVVQTAPMVPSISAPLPAGEALPPEARDILVEVEAQALPVQSDGIDGNATVSAASTLLEQPGEGTSYIVLPTLSNEVNGVLRSDLVNNILVSDELRANHIDDIVNLTVQEMYPGINLDYQGLPPELRPQFTDFAAELAAQLHANHKLLAVTVQTPTRIAEDRWDTGAYDWQALGQAVDTLKLPGLLRPQAYRPGGEMDALLEYATNLVDRYKIQVVLPSYSTDWVGDSVTLRSYAETLQLLSGSLILSEGRDVYAPGEEVTVQLSGSPSSVSFDDQIHSYWFAYTDGCDQRTV
ncbi:MAG TPA: hypothetical protein ENO24_09570, partial [Chloroflexi bacterium]|nr:hypothetical protein [Chloroflexota bacterium]